MHCCVAASDTQQPICQRRLSLLVPAAVAIDLARGQTRCMYLTLKGAENRNDVIVCEPGAGSRLLGVGVERRDETASTLTRLRRGRA